MLQYQSLHLLKDCTYYDPKYWEPGYHIAVIKKGTIGEASKIVEECEEFMDAVNQKVKVMELVELADMIGAVEAYLKKHHLSVKIKDLKAMSKVTKRAFKNGHRN